MMSITQTDSELINRMKELVIKDFNETKTTVLQNKVIQKYFPTLGRTHYIRMLISKMKFINAHLRLDVDCMQKEYEKFKSEASIVMEEQEKLEDGCIFSVKDGGSDFNEWSISEEAEKEGGYLYICNMIKKENDLMEEYISIAKMLKENGLVL